MNCSDDKSLFFAQHGCLHSQPQTVSDPQFQHSDFFDPRDLPLVKYEMLRRVQLEQVSVTEAVHRFGFSRPVFYQAQQRFTEEGLLGLIPRRRGPRRPHKLTEEVVRFLRQLQADQPALQACELAREVEQRFGSSVHPRSIERALDRWQQKKGARIPPKGKRSDPPTSPALDLAVRGTASTGVPGTDPGKTDRHGFRVFERLFSN